MKNWVKKKIIDFCYVTDFVANGSFASLRENVNYINSPDYAVLVRLTDFTKKWKKDFVYVSKASYEFLKKSSLLPNDMIMSNVGEPGIVFLVPDLKQPMTLGPNSILIRPKNSVATSKFIYLYFLSEIGKKQINSISTGAAQKKFNKTQFRDLQISLPPLSEQRHIVIVLDKVFAAIDKAKNIAEQNLKNAKELFESYLQSIFENKGDGWEMKKLGDLYEITSSKRVFKSEWEKSGTPFYRAREIVKLAKQGFVNNELFISEDMYDQYSKKYGIPKEGDIMVTGVGTLGICYVVKKDDKFYFKDGNIIWLKTKNSINSLFVEYAFKSDFLRKQIDNSVGATVGTYTIIKAKNTFIPVPSLSEQQKIVYRCDALSAQIKKLEVVYKQKLNDLEELKKSVLHKAFSGGI